MIRGGGGRLRRPRAMLLSKRANVFYLERAKVMISDGRVVYLTDTGMPIEKMFNIPDRNTAFLLLGKGTSITDAAARILSESNVMVGFCGSGGSPLFSALDIAFMPSQDEYRPTAYMQEWARRWFDDGERMALARVFLETRVEWTKAEWAKSEVAIPEDTVTRFLSAIEGATDTTELLSAEARWAKSLYAHLAQIHDLTFQREEGKRSKDDVADRINGFLDHGNYIAYGFAATALHGLGIPFSMPVLHGKTRRGALVFDLADLMKDGIVMPSAFLHGVKGSPDNTFRSELIRKCQDGEILDRLMTFISDLLTKNTDFQ